MPMKSYHLMFVMSITGIVIGLATGGFIAGLIFGAGLFMGMLTTLLWMDESNNVIILPEKRGKRKNDEN